MELRDADGARGVGTLRRRGRGAASLSNIAVHKRKRGIQTPSFVVKLLPMGVGCPVIKAFGRNAGDLKVTSSR